MHATIIFVDISFYKRYVEGDTLTKYLRLLKANIFREKYLRFQKLSTDLHLDFQQCPSRMSVEREQLIPVIPDIDVVGQIFTVRRSRG